MLESVHNERF
jgi:hypothetical protein